MRSTEGTQCSNCKRTRPFAKVCRSGNCKSDKEETGTNTEPWPEVDHIQSANSINRIDFYKAILFVDGQQIEFFFETGTPVILITPIMNPTHIKETTKCVVEVNKNPIKFKGEAVVEVKTEKSNEKLRY